MFLPKKEINKLIEKIRKQEEIIDNKNKEISENLDIAYYLNGELEEKDLIIKENKKKIEKIQSENYELKEKNQIFEEIYEKTKSIWHVNIDNAWRINQVTNKQDQHKIPKNFKIKQVYDLELSDDLKEVSFKYEGDRIRGTIHRIPRSLGEHLDIVDPIENKDNQKKIDITKIKDDKFIRNYLKSRGINANIGYWNPSIDFLIFYRGKKIKTSEFMNRCKFRNRESARKYLKKFIKFGLIKRVEKGVYEVLFNF